MVSVMMKAAEESPWMRKWAGLNDLPDSVHSVVLNTLQCSILHRNSFRSEGKPPKIASGCP